MFLAWGMVMVGTYIVVQQWIKQSLMSAYEPPPILLGAEVEGDAVIPEEFLEEIVDAAVADAATTPPPQSKQKMKQQGRGKFSSSDAVTTASTKKRKSRKQSSKNNGDDSSPPSKRKRKGKSRPAKPCNVIGCNSQSQDGKVCIKHGAPWSKKQCSVDNCTKQAINGGVCRRHGATIKECHHEGCTKHVQLGGACYEHTTVRRCSHIGDRGRCLNEAKSWGLCARHGGLVRLCYDKGCINKTFWGLCQLHGGPDEDFCCLDGCSNCLQDDGEQSDSDEGDRVKLCLHRGCIDLAKVGGVCHRHCDETYLYPLVCQPCGKNKVNSEGVGEKGSDEEMTILPTGVKQNVHEKNAPRKQTVRKSNNNFTLASSESQPPKPDAPSKLRLLEVVDRNCGGKDERHCVHEGCFRYAMEEGGLRCKKHINTKTVKTCRQVGCSEHVPIIGTYCKQHVIMPRQVKPRPPTSICNYAECNNKALKRGFCSLHKPKIIHKRCSHEGCSRFAKAKGVCITHGATIQRKLCSVAGCQNQAKRRRVCKKHGAYDDSIFVDI